MHVNIIGHPFKGPSPAVDAMHQDFYISGSSTTTTGGITATTALLTVASTFTFYVGQGILVVGAGAAGASLVSSILAINGLVLTLANTAGTTVAGAVVEHNDTVGIAAWLAHVSTANLGGDGGEGLIGAGTYRCSFTIPTRCKIGGAGTSTIFKAPSGLTTDGVMSITGASKRVEARDFNIDGNKATTSTIVSGIYLTSTNTAGLTGHKLEGIRIDNCKKSGVLAVLGGGTKIVNIFMTRVQAVSCDEDGCVIPEGLSDSHFTDCVMNLVGLNCWKVGGGWNHFVNCGGDDAGQITATSADWLFTTTANNNDGANCWGQDGKGPGVTFEGSNNNNRFTFTLFDNEGDAIKHTGGTYNVIDAHVPASTIGVTLSLLNATGGTNNKFNLCYDPAGLVTGNPALIGAAIDTVGEITLNGVKRTAVSMDPGNAANTLTASTITTTPTAFASTIALPANFFRAKKGLVAIAELEYTSSATPPTTKFEWLLGATVVESCLAIAPAVSQTNRGITRAVQILGTAAPGAAVAVESASFGAFFFSNSATGNTTPQGAINVATNGALTLSLRLTYSAGTAGNSWTLRALRLVEQINGGTF